MAETGYVKFFLTRNDALYGFIQVPNGPDLHFHYSGGCSVALDEKNEIIFKPTPPRYPRQGDELMYERGRNAKGPKAKAWYFKYQYDEMLEKSKRDLTLEDAKLYLAGRACDIIEHTYSTTQYEAVITTVTTEVTWLKPDDRYVAATGEFVHTTTRYSGGNESVKSISVVRVREPNSKFRDAGFKGADALTLKDLGMPRQVIKGKKQGVLWAGGWEEYIIDANTVRDMTIEELKKVDNSALPTFEGEKSVWLRCLFSKGLGNGDQAVQVLRHLGGGD